MFPIEIAGTTYFSAADVGRQLGITRQTLWRWRKANDIPSGQLYRGRYVVFSAQELEQIQKFANRLESTERSATTHGDDH